MRALQRGEPLARGRGLTMRLTRFGSGRSGRCFLPARKIISPGSGRLFQTSKKVIKIMGYNPAS